MDNIERIKELIKQGYEVKESNLYNRGAAFENIHGEEYELWISKVAVFLNKFYSENLLYQKFKDASERAMGNGVEYFNTMISVLKVLLEEECDGEMEFENVKTKNNLIDKIFISHSSKDEEYVKLFVGLLNNIGIKKSRNNIFCSSIPGYDIPEGEKIYDYIKKQFNQNILVIFILSENYYDSVACLNEMGATWIASKESTSVLLPSFSFSRIQGAIDPTVISFKMDDKNRLNDFCKKIIKMFRLEDIDNNIWEADRDEFLQDLDDLVRTNMYNNKLQRTDVEKLKDVDAEYFDLYLRFINKSKLPHECQELVINVIDTEDKEIELKVGKEELDKILLFGEENRREIIRIKKDSVKNIKDFSINRMKNWKTWSLWCAF